MDITISLVALFYNEEQSVEKVIRDGYAALKSTGEVFEIVAIQNGSFDRTPEILRRLTAELPELRILVIPVNRGAGYGAVRGWYAAVGKYVVGVSGDGQVDLEVIPRLFRFMRSCNADLAYGRRTERPDGWKRAIVSRGYNFVMGLAFGMNSKDMNGLPKILTRAALEAIQLKSEDQFLECEMMLKAQRLGLRICSVDVQFHPRRGGRSTVGWRDCWDYVRNLFLIRMGFGGRWNMAAVPKSARKAEWIHCPDGVEEQGTMAAAPAVSLSSTTR